MRERPTAVHIMPAAGGRAVQRSPTLLTSLRTKYYDSYQCISSGTLSKRNFHTAAYATLKNLQQVYPAPCEYGEGMVRRTAREITARAVGDGQ